MGVWGTTPEPEQSFLALCSSKTPIPGMQKHLCWPVGYRGMGVWGASPEPTIFFGIVQFKHPIPRCPRTPLLAYEVQKYDCLGRQRRSRTILSGIVQFKQPHPRYPKTPVLANRAQRCGCLGRQARTQTKFSAIVQLEPHHPKYPKTPLLTYGVQRYGCLDQHPKTPPYCLAVWHSNSPIPGIQEHLCRPMGYRGMGVWITTPEPHDIVWHRAVQTPHSLVSKKTLC